MTMREVLDKLRSIEDRLERLEKASKKRGLTWKAAIPPHILCRDIVKSYNSRLMSSFDYEMQRLAEFYNVASMSNRHDPKQVPEKAIACYYPTQGTAYYKEPTSQLSTVLHEFFHHLHHEGVISLYSNENAEKCANQFAQIIIKRGEQQP